MNGITIDGKVLITAVLAGFVGAVLAAIISHIRNWITLRVKKRMLLYDLYAKKIALMDLLATFADLLLRFDNLEVREGNMRIFNNLHTDTFNSIGKHDLLRIFGPRMPQLVDIYHMIEFLKENESATLFFEFVNKVNKYHDEIGEVVDDVRRSPRIMKWIELVRVTCISRIDTINRLLLEIEPFVKHIRKHPRSSR